MSRFVPAIVLGAGCALTFGAREQLRMDARAPMASLQLDAPGYKLADIKVPEEEQRVAGMSDYVMREYTRDSTDIFSVYVGYYDYQQQGKTIHSPKNCLPGAGWEQVDASTRLVNTGTGPGAPINRYLLANKGAQALVYYWYQGRGRVEASEYRVKWNLLRDAALHGRTEEALVRIVVPVDARDRSTLPEKYRMADSVAMATARQLIPRVTAMLPVAPAES